MSAPTDDLVIDQPGVYSDIPDGLYHADPVPGGSLSSSGARRLLPPSCPARFDHERRNPPAPRPAFDLGHAAHLEVLGTGPTLAVIDADDWRTKAAKEARDQAHAEGKVPVLAVEHEQVQAMADALRRHPVAGPLFQPCDGQPEQSLFWVDKRTGIWCRARLDWLRNPAPDRRLIIGDYKTTRSAAPAHISRAVHDYGYHQQADWYLDGVRSLGLDPDPAFLFAFQEKTPPYLVTVVELDHTALAIGRDLNRQAREIYRDCTAAGVWPAYTASDDIELISLPAWVERRYTEETW